MQDAYRTCGSGKLAKQRSRAQECGRCAPAHCKMQSDSSAGAEVSGTV